MNLQAMLAARADAGKPVRAGLIGAGKFGSMFLAQVPSSPASKSPVIADLDPERAKAACRNVGWDSARIARTHFAGARRDACQDERCRCGRRGDRQSCGRHRPCAGGDRGRQAHRDGQRRSRHARRPVSRANKARAAGVDLFDGLWRPAGADRRNGRLGALRWIYRRRRGQRAPNICRPTTRSRRIMSGSITG